MEMKRRAKEKERRNQTAWTRRERGLIKDDIEGVKDATTEILLSDLGRRKDCRVEVLVGCVQKLFF